VIELGLFLRKRLHIPLRLDILTRLKNTSEQAGLSRDERLKNLRNAFGTRAVSIPTHVAILDDVITTGSTVTEVATTLRKAGVKHIEVWSVARAT
jgi:predicted amidophosphoribosyltransferase